MIRILTFLLLLSALSSEAQVDWKYSGIATVIHDNDTFIDSVARFHYFYDSTDHLVSHSWSEYDSNFKLTNTFMVTYNEDGRVLTSISKDSRSAFTYDKHGTEIAAVIKNKGSETLNFKYRAKYSIFGKLKSRERLDDGKPSGDIEYYTHFIRYTKKKITLGSTYYMSTVTRRHWLNGEPTYVVYRDNFSGYTTTRQTFMKRKLNGKIKSHKDVVNGELERSVHTKYEKGEIVQKVIHYPDQDLKVIIDFSRSTIY